MRIKWTLPLAAVAAGAALVLPGAAGSAIAAGTGPTRLARGPVPATHPPAGGRFYGVSAAPNGSAWAVGIGNSGALIMRWKGKWINSLATNGFFFGAKARTSADVWAVGGTDWFSPVPLVEHWNGRRWRQVPAPTPDAGGYFNSVTATSAGNAWAVGNIGAGPAFGNPNAPLIEHWNGRSWKQARYPAPAGAGLMSVAATSASNAWAVGSIGSGPSVQTLIEHWNGARWREVPSNLPGNLGILQGVAATGPDNAWAVGFTQDGPGGTPLSLILHWNGTKWAAVRSPNPTGQTNLIGVAAATPTDAWAVGYTNPSACSNGGPPCGAAAFHWNGKRWSNVPTVTPPSDFLNAFESVYILSASNVWAVGSTDWSSTLIEHWNGHAWIWHLPS